jgi:hypothetical protein
MAEKGGGAKQAATGPQTHLSYTPNPMPSSPSLFEPLITLLRCRARFFAKSGNVSPFSAQASK